MRHHHDFLSWPEMRQQLHYLAWLLFTLVSFPTAGHAAILILCVCCGEYVEPQRLLLTLLGALTLAPSAYVWRKYGERHCRFAEFDEVLDRCLQRVGPHAQLGRLEAFITAIDAATGFERQLVRNEAKAWLKAHAPELSEEERAFANEHLGYLGRW